MTAPTFKFDEVGVWSEVKLEIIQKYGAAYTKAFAKHSYIKKYYIDGFAGAGAHLSKRSGEKIEGSPARALKVRPPFDAFYFIDIEEDKTAQLQKLCEGRADVHIHTGDCNPYLRSLLPDIRYDRYERALCLLDPYGLHLDWDVIALAGNSQVLDLFLNFPVMDINRNAIWRQPDNAPQEGVERLTRFWGDESWKAVAYAESQQLGFFEQPDLVKQSNETIAEGFRKRLREVARFAYVPAPLAMRNSNNAVVYYLFFASAKPVAEEIITDVFDKYR